MTDAMRPLSAFRWLIGAALLALSLAAAAESLDRIVAVANDDVILQSELDRELKTVKAELARRNTRAPNEQVLTQQVLERLIMQKLQLAVANRAGIRIDEATLNAAVQRIAEQNQLTLSQFREALEKEGYDYAKFRDGLRTEITLARLHQRQAESQVTVTPQEIDEFLAAERQVGTAVEYLVGHILIATPENASADQIAAARRKADELRASLAAGADFAQAAAANSDSSTALEGGSLGWRTQSQLPTLFAAQVATLKVGDVGEVIQSPSGFHIIKLQDKREGARQVVTQTHARHILIRPNEVVSDQDAKLRLQTLKRRIEGGDDFADIARANSDDKASAVQGGDLGWASPGTFVPTFEEALDKLQPGQISEPFETRFGWHIVQLLERREYDNTDEFRRAKAAETIRARKSEEVLEAWLRRMRDDAYVDIRLES